MMTYALGRGVEKYDRAAVKKIVRSAMANQYRFSAFVTGIITSVPFQQRRGATVL
jgi:predicted GTPase